MATALHLLSMDRFEFSLQLADSVPHFPALDLVKGLADPSPATSPTLSLFGPRHALAGREVLEPCQLHLKLRFFGASMPMKNLEDDGPPSVNPHAGHFSNASDFCARDLTTRDHSCGLTRRLL